MLLQPFALKNVVVDPPLFCAPMAGVTHSAFRRLLSDFGNYGALYTEMLSGKAVLHEKINVSPYTKMRSKEGVVWYQIALIGEEDILKIIEKLNPIGPVALDINAACPAPEMTSQGYGAALFRDLDRFKKAIENTRRSWTGVLTVKCRIGDENEKWREQFVKRLKIMEGAGIDAIVVHPRFFKEKLKRKARWELFDWIASETSLPIIANGDIVSRRQLLEASGLLAGVSGFMVGRMAVVKPWIFCELAGKPVDVNYASVWKALYNYVLEDFPREKAIGRIKEFSKYFAQNFLFGHELYSSIQASSSLEKIYANALNFLEANPKVTNYPTVKGL
jgi:tRNA-dihydrouridine synthase B